MPELATITVGGIALSKLLDKFAEKQLLALFGKGVQKLGKSLSKDPHLEAMKRAFQGFAGVVLSTLESLGYDDHELEAWTPGIVAMVEGSAVADELWLPLIDSENKEAPAAEVLRSTWKRLDQPALPEDFRWAAVAASYRRRVERQRIIDDELREQLKVEALVALRDEVRGTKPTGDLAKYAARVRTKYRILDLTHFVSPTVDEPRGLELRDAFIPQQVREDPPPVEVPSDLALELALEGKLDPESLGLEDEGFARRLRDQHTAYIKRPAKPVVEFLAEVGSQKVVVVGGPGSGKSTLTRYLLLGALDESEKTGFAGRLPLLIELRDFHAERVAGRCQDFLSYLEFLGSDQGHFLNATWLDQQLQERPSLVLFDGLDEIFEAQPRHRVTEAIVGFCHRYPGARVVVSTRPVGYHDKPLRDAGFRHVKLEDLDDGQIETFVRGWFGLLFDSPKAADQRIGRVLDAAKRSASIRLLAGNPMLLTIMCLIAQHRDLPRDRASFYQQAADVLCHHWDTNRGLVQAGFEEGYIDLDDKKELLRRIAFRMQSQEKGLAGNFIRDTDLRKAIVEYLEQRYRKDPGESKKTANALIGQLRERNYVLCLRGPELYGFVHRTFLEFYCAAEIVERLRNGVLTIEQVRDDFFAEHWRDEAWTEPLRLVCGMVGDSDAEVLLTYLVDSADPDWNRYLVPPLRHLELAVQCLSERRDPQAIGTAARCVARLLFSFLETIQLDPTPSGHFHEVLPAVTQRWVESRLGPSLRELPDGWTASERSDEELVQRLGRQSHWLLRDLFAQNLGRTVSNRSLAQGETFILCARGTSNVRRAAVQALASGWSNEESRALVTGRATQDDRESVRRAAVRALASGWGDEESRALVTDRATQDVSESVRRAAVQALASGWSDEESRALVTDRATQDDSLNVRSTAVQALASGWSDEESRAVLTDRATQDDSESVRIAAVQALASGWGDEGSRAVLTDRATQDASKSVRIAAVRALASGWSDEGSRAVVTDRATQDDSESVRRAAIGAFVRIGGRSAVSVFISRDLDALNPFFDPQEPIPGDHLRKAAKRLRVTEASLLEDLDQLREKLGANIYPGTPG